uniref:Uncharacterized protein n=1 Tax=Lepeophtheirus salmonis TaxID=72036 RepID=A0A0K2UXC3_LEPSM
MIIMDLLLALFKFEGSFGVSIARKIKKGQGYEYELSEKGLHLLFEPSWQFLAPDPSWSTS